MFDFISVIVPTYNPDKTRLHKTIAGLKAQNLDLNFWELILIDNNSSKDFQIDLSWHINSKKIIEPRQGLAHARIKGFKIARGSIIVMVDDDNVLAVDYLTNIVNIFRANDRLGAIGGKSLPAFDKLPPGWIGEFYGNLALRDFGEDPIFEEWKHEFPDIAPIGAGMAINKTALNSYLKNSMNGASIIEDRTKDSLGSGGDNDIIIEIMKAGWRIGYFPALKLHHLIPEQRVQVHYLSKLLKDSNKSWVKVLEKHQINPWRKISKTSACLRKIKCWFTYRAWKDDVAYIKWNGACGLIDGRASLR